MTTDPALLWTAKPPPLCKPRPGEPLFTLLRGPERMLCELHYHGEYGVQAQFLKHGELSYSRRFDTRAQAAQWG